MTFETIDTLEIIQRTDGKWLVEDTSYRVWFGPFATHEQAKARKEREVAERRIGRIERERGA